jgi:hypothetical protein
MRRVLRPAFALFIAVVGISTASATVITSNPTITSGGLTFNNFNCSFAPMSSGTVVGGCGSVSVAGAGSGLVFTNGITTNGVGTPDLAVAFAVVGGPVTTIGLSMTDVIAGTETLYIKEDVYAEPYTPSSALLGELTVVCNQTVAGASGCDASSILSDTISIAATSNLYIIKDVSYDGHSGNAVGNITSFTQTFNSPSVAPEPEVVGLFASGLAVIGFVGVRRRRK